MGYLLKVSAMRCGALNPPYITVTRKMLYHESNPSGEAGHHFKKGHKKFVDRGKCGYYNRKKKVYRGPPEWAGV